MKIYTLIKSPKEFRERWKDTVQKKRAADVTNVGNMLNIATNRITSYHQVEIPGCSHYIHLPLFPHDLGLINIVDCAVVLFRLNSNDVGIAISSYNDNMTDEFFERSELIDGKVTL